jgi:hypothetical protein
MEIAAIAAALVPPFAILDRGLAVRARRSQTRETTSRERGERAG